MRQHVEYSDIQGDIISKIIVNGKTLAIFYNKCVDGLHHLHSDEEVKTFIADNLDIAYDYAIMECGNNIFCLNIASTVNYGDFDWEGDAWSNNLLKQQIHIYKPLIEKFLSDA